jgi:DNA-binding CsgD family transcriptional regulator
LDDAENQLKDALSEADKLPPPIRFDLYLALSRIYAAAKSWDDCINVLQRAAELETEQGIGHLQRVELHTEFHAAYRAKEQLGLALHHLEKMVQFKEKHLNDTSVAKLAEWEALYQMERLKENQHKLSKKTAELEEILTRSTNEKRALLDQLASYDVLIDEMLEALPEERKDRFRRLARSARRTNMDQQSDQLVQNRISEKHPELTPAELKVCFMLVNGWTTKEMADRSGTSVKTIEKHRTSIRKKAAIPRSVSLQVYLSGIAKVA